MAENLVGKKCRNALGQPDLQLLVQLFGGYHKISPGAWELWDAMLGAYHKSITTIPPARPRTIKQQLYLASDECQRCHAYGEFGYSAASLTRMGRADLSMYLMS